MENPLTEMQLYQKNAALKKQVEQQSKILYQVLGKCFYHSTHSWQTPSHPTKNKINGLEQVLTTHLRSVGKKQTKISEHLQNLTDSFLAFQVMKAQSLQMRSILNKYHEHLIELRTKTIEKESQLYYRRKNLYQCFEDEYDNCVPNPQRMEGILYNQIQRENIINQCLNLCRGVNQMKKTELALNHQRETQRINQNNKKNELILQASQQEQQIQEEQSSQAKQLKDLSLLKSVNNVQKSQKNNELMQTPICLPYRNMKKLKIQFEQTTSAELKIFGSSKSISNQTGKRNIEQENKKIPEFKQMSKRDFELFRVYYNKIERLNWEYQQCIQQYKNYIGVYKVLIQQNLNLLSKVMRRYQLKCKKRSKFNYFPNYFDHSIQNQSQQFEAYFSYDPKIQDDLGWVLEEELLDSPHKKSSRGSGEADKILGMKQNIAVQLQNKQQNQKIQIEGSQGNQKKHRFNQKQKENMVFLKRKGLKRALINFQ